MSVDWNLKIQALLYPYPPDFALDPDEGRARERGKEYLRSLELNDSVPEHVEQAHEIAFGLDVPPFVRQTDTPDNLVLTHPLSGESESLKDKGITLPPANHIQSLLQEALKNFKPLKKNENKELFIALWRFFAEFSQKKVPNGLRPYWGLLPADPRIPDHSIWDHASLASAIAGTWDGRYRPALLLFTIGSAQEFLMTARRTQDLWMGSYLLSYLTWEAIKVIADKCGPDCLIYPDLRGQPLTDLWLFQDFFKENGDLWRTLGGPSFLSPQGDGLGEDLKIASFPNLFTAIVPEGRAPQLAQEAINAVQCKWKLIAANVRKAIEKAMPSLANDSTWGDPWEKQIPDLIDRLGIFWVIYPLDRLPAKDDPSEKVQQAIKEFEDLIKLDAGDAQKAFEDFKKLYEASKSRAKDNGDKANIGMGYSPVSQLAARTLTNRKSLRDFCQHPAEGEKCSMCGVRSALHPAFESIRQYLQEQAKGDAKRLGEIKRMQELALLREFWDALRKISDPIKLAGRIRRGDRLCAVCLTKRLAWEHHFIPQFKKILSIKIDEAHLLFPSTSSIATASFKKDILKKLQEDDEAKRLQPVVIEYVKKLKGFPYYSAPIPALEEAVKSFGDDLQDFTRIDGDWLFDESFEPERFKREYPEEAEKLLPKKLLAARNAVKALRGAAKILKIEPSKYYALISMDGDHMGQWVSGQNGPPLPKLLHPDVAKDFTDKADLKDLLCRKRPLGPALHKALTAAQKNFALQVVRQIVEEEHVGKLIYAGGDDVLAFVPISELLPVLRKLRWLCSGDRIDDEEIRKAKLEKVEKGFATRVNNDKDRRRFMLLGSKFSLSTGVAIVHHTHPFSHAIEEAYRAMKEHAKKKLDRDAFAIHLMKRSGEPLEVGARWKLKAGDSDNNVLEYVENLVQVMKDGVLSSKLAYDLNDEAPGMAKLEERVQKAELCRLIGRHVSKKEKLQGITDQIIKLWAGLHGDDPEGAWKRLTDLLLLAHFLAQEGGDGGE